MPAVRTAAWWPPRPAPASRFGHEGSVEPNESEATAEGEAVPSPERVLPPPAGLALMFFGARAAGGGFTGAAGGALIMLAIVAFWFRHWLAGSVVLAIALLLRAGGTLRRRAPRMMVSPYGVTWMHPVRGNGAMMWRDVGALAVREARGGRELGVYLVPRPPDRPGPEPSSFILTTEDLGGSRESGESALREFVVTALPRLSADVVSDRETRRRLEAWGVRWPPVPENMG